MLRGLMKPCLIRFALWSLQSRDEGVDREGAKRWREKERRGEWSEEWDMRQDIKMGANGGRMKNGEVWARWKKHRVGLLSRKKDKNREIDCMEKVAGHTRIEAQTVTILHSGGPRQKSMLSTWYSTLHVHSDFFKCIELLRSAYIERPKLAPLCRSQLKQQLFAEKESSCSQSRNSLMSGYGKACRHALIHMGERGSLE